MRAALGFLLALLTVEGLVLLVRPNAFRAIVAGTSEKTLRVVGLVEIILVLVVLALACNLL